MRSLSPAAFGRVFFLGYLCVFLPTLPAAAAGNNTSFTPAQYWEGPWANAPRLPLVGDCDGDGHADLVSLWPENDGIIDFVQTAKIGKTFPGNVARRSFGKNGIAAVCGHFIEGEKGAALVGIFQNGEVRVGSGMTAGTNEYSRDSLAALLPVEQIPRLPLRSLAADFDGDGHLDILLVGADHRGLLLLNQPDTQETLHFTAMAVSSPLPTGEIGAGIPQSAPDQRARFFFLSDSTAGKASLFRSVFTFDNRAIPSPTQASHWAALASPVLVLEDIPVEAHLAVGRFRGEESFDVLIGQWLLPGGNPAQKQFCATLPTVAEAKNDRVWLVGDFDNNGKDDLLRARDTHDRFGDDALIHFSFDSNDRGPGYYSSSNDGLPDIWKTGRALPGGLNLAALGCRVGRRDLLVEVQPMANVEPVHFHAELKKAVAYFARLPIVNPDGSRGIALHLIYRESIPMTVRDYRKWDDWSDAWREMWPRQVLPEHRGITHYMGIQNEPAGFGGGDRSWSWVSWHGFVHEMGHQLLIGHAGGGETNWSAVYPSLMNYAYSYGLNDDSEQAGYSTGPLAALGSLNEEHLNEVLPIPFDKAAFLARAPYHFPLKPGWDKKTTLIDWNWNGVFGEENIRADINYAGGVQMNPRFDVGSSPCGPSLATIGPSNGGGLPPLLLFAGIGEAMSPQNPGGCSVRLWEGSDRDRDGGRWSAPTIIEGGGVTGDLTTTSLADAVWAAYPTTQGVVLRRITLDTNKMPRCDSERLLVPQTLGAVPTIAAWNHQLVLFLWRGPALPIGLVPLFPDKGMLRLGSEERLDFVSETPVGAVAPTGATDDSEALAPLWVARIEPAHSPENARRVAVRRLVAEKAMVLSGKRKAWHTEEEQWTDTYSGIRPLVFWQAEPQWRLSGRLMVLCAGLTRETQPWAAQYLTQQTAYPNEHGGWQYRKYYDDSYASPSVPGACWFGDNLAYVLRLHDSRNPSRNNILSLSFHATGVTAEKQADRNDIDVVTQYGLSHSLNHVNP